MILFQNVDANKYLFGPNNLSLLIYSSTSKQGTRLFFFLSGASWKVLVFSLKHLGTLIFVIK